MEKELEQEMKAKRKEYREEKRRKRDMSAERLDEEDLELIEEN